ncbi:hypothetical protein FGO68_gene16111 [Halteria grandinella]|uniref:Uncharacterized protein n=1 Tax=Halteria grandinella TaxID=5974 RepID=A0A8J8NLR5_HALGN|nr:hypothetical protein FGO68_gene16111 [Halteria grandinella]
MFSAFFKQARSSTPKEYGKHTDITPTCTAAPEQTWLEYKQLTNDQNAFITVYGEKKSTVIKRQAQEKKDQELQDSKGAGASPGLFDFTRMTKSVSADLSEGGSTTRTNSEESMLSGGVIKKSQSLKEQELEENPVFDFNI